MGTSDKKILIVEDNAVQAMMLEKIFEDLEFTVIGIVERGEKAIRKTEKMHPDLIIMDIFLDGDMTGIEAMEKIREKSDVPVIYVSGNSDKYYRNMAEKTNCAAFFNKPVNQNDLRDAVYQVFETNGGSKKWSWPFGLFV